MSNRFRNESTKPAIHPFTDRFLRSDTMFFTRTEGAVAVKPNLSSNYPLSKT